MAHSARPRSRYLSRHHCVGLLTVTTTRVLRLRTALRLRAVLGFLAFVARPRLYRFNPACSALRCAADSLRFVLRFFFAAMVGIDPSRCERCDLGLERCDGCL